MISIYRFLIVSVVIGWAINIKAQIKVACVGNSITENIALSNKHKYPSILQDLLGNGYIVRNYGIGARTMLKKGDYPYWNEERYKEVLAWNPDIVIVKMGTNDAKAKNWVYKDNFENDYIEFVRSFQTLPSHPKVFICYPIPTFKDNFLPVEDQLLVKEMMPMIDNISKATCADIIDLHTPLVGKDDCVYDKVHPNEKGTKIMARVIARKICPHRKFPFPPEKKINVVFVGNSITEATYLKITPPEWTTVYLDSLGYDVQSVNCGKSGYTTFDFLPGKDGFEYVKRKADELYKKDKRNLVFSFCLGVNDSACTGTNGAPVSAEQYESNMQLIIDSLCFRFPEAKVVLHYPIWYSPNTYNSAMYLKEGLKRLQTYFAAIERLGRKNKGRAMIGDTKGFKVFRKHYKKYHTPQEGKRGVFYLHPNAEGARVLGRLWSEGIKQ